jgi:hypothetical protein
MSEIQRYEFYNPKDLVNGPLIQWSEGRYVLYTDHFAALAEKEREIIQAMSDAQRDASIINKFTTRNKELKAVLREQTLLTNEKVRRIKELEALSIIDHKTIHTQQARIKGLESMIAEKEEEIRKLIKLDHKKNLTTTALIEQIAALQATIKAQAEYNTLELARIAQLQEKVEALQAEANRNMEELCRLRAEKKDEYCQGCALPERVKELEEEVINAVEIAKMELIEAALGGKK